MKQLFNPGNRFNAGKCVGFRYPASAPVAPPAPPASQVGVFGGPGELGAATLGAGLMA